MSQWFAEMCSCVISFHKVASSSHFTNSDTSDKLDVWEAQLYFCFSPHTTPNPPPPTKDWSVMSKTVRL